MAAILRASGPDFDVDAFVAECDWDVSKVYHRGEAVLAKSRPGGRGHAKSGLNVVVSDAGFFDQSHFTRAFKFQTGTTPAEYRAARKGNSRTKKQTPSNTW